MAFQTALITGGAKRLGKAMALTLAQRGINVAIHYNSSAADANATVDELQALGVKACALQADLLDDAQTSGLIAAAADRLGPLDILINNASIFEYDRLETATAHSWDRHIGSNLRAPFMLTQAFATQARDADQDTNGEALSTGCVINMIDQRVRKLTPEFMTYTISKMGLWAFTQTAAQALAPRIRVNAIAPGPTVQGYRQSDAHFKAQRDHTILQRGSNPEDITTSLKYILDSPSLTGQLLCNDAGQHLGWQTRDIIGTA